jgi:hypothetical protein
MNIIEVQQELEYWPDQRLIEEAQQPTGSAPTYLVITEVERRTKERQAYENEMAKQEQPQMTVAEEKVMELQGSQPMGGIPDVDPNLMQNQMMAQQMPQQQMPQQQMPQQMPQGQPMAMRGGGAIRYQGAGQIEPWEAKLAEEGYMVDENGDIVEIPREWGVPWGAGGLAGAGGVKPGGWLFDPAVYGMARTEEYPEGAGMSWGRAGDVALDLAKAKVLFKAGKLGKSAFKEAGGFKGMTKGIRDKYNEGIKGLRARLGGTGPITTPQVPNPANPGGLPIPILTRPTSLAGRGVDIALNYPITTGVLTAGAVAGAIPDVDMESTEAIEAQAPKTLDETQTKEYVRLRARLLQNARDLFDMKDPEAFNKFFGKNIPREEQYKNLLSLEASGTLPEIDPQQPGGSEYGKGVASTRGRVMQEIETLLGSDTQAIRDQQSAALVQLGAGIAAGDIAGGLSSAGREVSALKAARSAEKIKGIMALIELEYRQGLIGTNEVSEMINLLELWKENMGDPKAIAGLEAQIMALMPRLRNTQSASAIRSLTESDLA